MTNTQKNEVVDLIRIERERLGSNARVARKASVSEATISQMVNTNWELIAESMWQKVGDALGYKPNGWQIVETNSMRVLWGTLEAAKRESMFIGLAGDAGLGKSTGLKAYANANSNTVFYLECREWAKREFLLNLARSIGADVSEGNSNDTLIQSVVQFFRQRRATRPLLILDQANSLKAAALRSLIMIFNGTEDDLGMVIAGTPHLEKMMHADARRDKPGGKELLSRFGRKLLSLTGSTMADVQAICQANGISDAATARAIFAECEPVSRMAGRQSVKVVEDLRRVKRCIKRELLKASGAAASAEAEQTGTESAQ